jgi:aspartyl-tRNA(Asn)/glutamyl-tRNA(Gln) amidotransferase subunit B
MKYEAVIGLEVHAEMLTQSKMFCSCPVVDSTQAEPNVAICPVCTGMPGVLPVVNRQAVEYAIRVALALHCEVQHTSIFARKNYFYPDLPKGYQISQYEYPLGTNGYLTIHTSEGARDIRITRVHLEEDTGKLTHVHENGHSYSLVDLNRSGVALLEIVSEPDMHTVEEARAYGMALRSMLRYLGVNSGDMEKGVIRFEANVSIRPEGSQELGTRVEIKNLNSFRAMERATEYQLKQQAAALDRGERIRQETLGWDEAKGATYSQRGKEEAHDYRYFPEPDLPPLVVEQAWVDKIAAGMPELPNEKRARFIEELGLNEYSARQLVDDRDAAEYFEQAAHTNPSVPPQTVANWVIGELFAWMNTSGEDIAQIKATPQELSALLVMLEQGAINMATAKTVLTEMLQSGKPARQIVSDKGLQQISDTGAISAIVQQVLADNPQELQSYLNGKETLSNWFFGQAMRAAKGQGNPQVIRAELERQLEEVKQG